MKKERMVIGLICVLMLACLLAAWTPGGRARMRPTPQPQVVEHSDGSKATSTPVYDADCVDLTMMECSIVRQTVYAQTPQPTYEVIWVSDQLITMGPDDLGYPAP